MGVPLLLTWLRRHFSHCFLKTDAIGTIDNLYVDLNSLLYPAVNIAADALLRRTTAERSSVATPGSSSGATAITMKEAEDAILAALVTLLEQLCAMNTPKHLLYIAADGVSPMGKMSHQRARRQNSTARNAAKRLCDASGFDITLLTCGSAFMERVTHAAHYFSAVYVERVNAKRHAANLQRVRDYYSQPPPQQHAATGGASTGTASSTVGLNDDEAVAVSPKLLPLLTVMVNDVTAPGEGEHKIFEAIRAFRSNPKYNHNVRHCICSSDTDVIVSALTVHEPFMYALRFDPSGPHEPVAFCIQTFRETLFARLSPRSQDAFERSLHDFVFLLLLFGNDYLPRISDAADIADGALDAFIKFLADNFVSRGKRLVDENTGEIHVESAVYLFEYLEEMRPQGGRGGGLSIETGAGGNTLEWGFEPAEGADANPALALNGEREEDVRDRCYAYWTMLQWAMQYCCGPVPSWNSAYPYTTVPSISQLRKHCAVVPQMVLVRDMPNAPLDVLAQLIILTPFQSIGRVLPPALKQDYSETIGKQLTLPFESISLPDVVKWCNERRLKLTPAEAKRLESYNVGGVSVALFWDREQVAEELQDAKNAATQHRKMMAPRRGAAPASGGEASGKSAPSIVVPTLFTGMGSVPRGKINLSALPGLGKKPALATTTAVTAVATPSDGTATTQPPPAAPPANVPPPLSTPQPDGKGTHGDTDIPVQPSSGSENELSFSFKYQPLPQGAAVATIDGGAWLSPSPFSSLSERLALTRGSTTHRVFLRFVCTNPLEMLQGGNNFPQWKPLPQCNLLSAATATVSSEESRKRGRDECDSTSSVSSVTKVVHDEERLRLQREEQVRRRQQAQKELADAREAARLQQQIRSAMQK